MQFGCNGAELDGVEMATTKAELDRYFKIIEERVPVWISQFIRRAMAEQYE
ncbi:hypothetical protein JQ597_34315 [Bradyrhizobium sp. AUGA SZCCT0177]|uniref:hypothetical protein n=1 Tax=Bradyrhizobium sp. AUGA SZCCT0177 TaxID=2807665 RepID=UPI001BAA0B2F|nr:hypothetical protein [Bradyrhizobium sp. AUGA SZCCT0177]MBR1287140.1 hypothetical protein [Bradyrhizobium sp. AUGA SZCCT0177]